jgi:hypothetical protein
VIVEYVLVLFRGALHLLVLHVAINETTNVGSQSPVVKLLTSLGADQPMVPARLATSPSRELGSKQASSSTTPALEDPTAPQTTPYANTTTPNKSIPQTRARDRSSLSQTATMPTPESAMFKAAKPTVPPTFDGVDYDDNNALKAAQDSIIREQWVQSMMARLVREELGKCYYREGVNHLEKCGHLRGE